MPTLDLSTFARFTQAALLLLDEEGRVVDASQSAKDLLAGEDRKLIGASLYYFTQSDDEAPRRYLAECRRAGMPIPGTLHLRTPTGLRELRCRGARVVFDPVRILLDIQPHQELDRRFMSLSRKVAQANAEIARRRLVEGRLRETTERLETLLAERTRQEEDRRRFEAQMQQAQKLESLGLLAGGIAHDFNNLLLTIRGNAELAERKIDADSPAHREIDEILGAARRAADLCTQMLAYSGRGQFLTKPIHVTHVVEDMSDLLRASVAKQVLLETDLASDLPAVIADVTQVRQVLLNLVINASDAVLSQGRAGAGPGNGTGAIRIETGVETCDEKRLRRSQVPDLVEPGEYVFLRVVDDGVGMDDATIARIFEPFFTTKDLGRGLGLAAVLGIVRGHRGALVIDSEPERGTSFTVYLPPSSEIVQREQVQAGVDTARPTQGWTVLLVDDEEHVRSAVGRILIEAGFEVLTAVDGLDAIDVYQRHEGEIDIVLLDLSMPRLNGEKTLERLRRLDPTARVVLSSGFHRDEIRSDLLEGSEAPFLQKPYGMGELLDTFRQVLGDSEPPSRAGA